jgi:PPOX class probable F420-dependent enzyme
MTDAQRDAFLAQPRIAILSTVDREGAPVAVPIWFEWDGARARLFTGRSSPKVRRLRSDPRVCLTVAEPAERTEAYVIIEGTAELEEGGWALAQRLAPRYYDAGRAERALAEWGSTPDRWIEIVITPTRIRSLAAT